MELPNRIHVWLMQFPPVFEVIVLVLVLVLVWVWVWVWVWDKHA